MANLLAVQMERGVASARKDFQWLALAALIALKYPPFDSLAARVSAGSLVDRALREAEWNSFLKVDRRVDHHGFALVDGRQSGVCCLRREASVSSVCRTKLPSLGGWGEQVVGEQSFRLGGVPGRASRFSTNWAWAGGVRRWGERGES